MNVKTTMTMVVAMVVMIGLTGLASAGTTMDYTVNFNGVGDGSVDIYTSSPVGTDAQRTSWTNCITAGKQVGTYNNGQWLSIDRTTTITGDQDRNPASGKVMVISTMVDPSAATGGGFIGAAATYSDNDAYGSYVQLKQSVDLRDSDLTNGDAGYEMIVADTRIKGYAYGDPTAVITGQVDGVTDGNSMSGTGIYTIVNDGNLRMKVDTTITDDTNDRETSRTDYNVHVTSPASTSDGNIYGYADVDHATQVDVDIYFVDTDTHTHGYFYAVTV